MESLWSMRKKCPYSEFFWFISSRIRTECGQEKFQIRTLFPQWMSPCQKLLVIENSIKLIQESTLNVNIFQIAENISMNEHHYWNVFNCVKSVQLEFFLVRFFLYSDWIQKNTDQKKLRIWTLFTQCWNVLFDLRNISLHKHPL